ncbi:MAG TPA: DUF2306 domain-containing protein [Puia sp.]|uniref:DUF2306 domain-containing protein n=1 Tax=Puia sp. TaxID=2045100 RepID=UPI002CF5B673|nr:DUF2306 domain-containing protein [Puia sp.]HVU93646.1 DUF2306 domain-containing protein [Puia sp.]
MRTRLLGWIPFVFLAIAVGLYPLIYYIVDMHDKGFLTNKPAALQADPVWHLAFYAHITFGGIALLTGWSQFSPRLRARYLNTHRWLGRVYLVAVGFASLAGLYLSYFATGGITCSTGFGTLALLWLGSAIQAYSSIRRLDIDRHRDWMIVNYSLTFAAVTLRIWLPILQYHVFHEFITPYRIVSWWSWVPNLAVALLIIRKRRRLGIKA